MTKPRYDALLWCIPVCSYRGPAAPPPCVAPAPAPAPTPAPAPAPAPAPSALVFGQMIFMGSLPPWLPGAVAGVTATGGGGATGAAAGAPAAEALESLTA